MKNYLLYIILLLSNVMYSQIDTVAKITVLSGSSLNINFNSYDKIQSGITTPYSNGWTRMRVLFQLRDITSGTPVYTDLNWELCVRSSTAAIQHDGGGIGMPLNTIRVRIDNTGAWQAITNIDAQIRTGTSGETITIAYDCGVANTVAGNAPGYYFGDLIFTLRRAP